MSRAELPQRLHAHAKWLMDQALVITSWTGSLEGIKQLSYKQRSWVARCDSVKLTVCGKLTADGSRLLLTDFESDILVTSMMKQVMDVNVPIL